MGRAKVGGGGAAAPFSAPPNIPKTLPLPPPPRSPTPTAPGTKKPMPDTHGAAAVPSRGGGFAASGVWQRQAWPRCSPTPVEAEPPWPRPLPLHTSRSGPPSPRPHQSGRDNYKQRPPGSCLCVPMARLLQSWSSTDQCGAPAKMARHLGTPGPLCPAWDWTSLPGKPQPRAHGIAEDSSA